MLFNSSKKMRRKVKKMDSSKNIVNILYSITSKNREHIEVGKEYRLRDLFRFLQPSVF